MPTCRIIFSGLCAFVPHGGYLLTPDDPPSYITALIPNVLVPTEICYEEYRAIVPPHFPLLGFNLGDLRSGDTRDFLHFQKTSDTHEKGLHPLLRREVEIWIDGRKPEPDEVECVHRPADCPFFQDDDLYWLVRMEEAYGNDCAIKPQLLRSLVGEDLVTSRLKMTTGTFMVTEVKEEWYPERLSALSPIKDKKILLGRGQRSRTESLDAEPAEEYEGKVATRLALEIEFEEEVAFVIKEYGGKDPRTLVFAPPEGPEDLVEIVIQNLEANEHFGFPDDIPVPAMYGDDSVLIDYDFAIYYDMLVFNEDSVEKRALVGIDTTGGFGKPCSPAVVLESLPMTEAPNSTGQRQQEATRYSAMKTLQKGRMKKAPKRAPGRAKSKKSHSLTE